MSAPGSSPPIRVLVADDHDIVRRGLRALVRRQKDIVIVAEAATAAEMVQHARETSPDVIVTDLRMPGESTLDAIRDLLDVSTLPPRIVVFTGFDSKEEVLLSFRAGASGYVVKGGPSDILTAIRTVHEGRRYFDPQLDDLLVARVEKLCGAERSGAELFSAREAQVLEMTALGLSSKEMAERLGIGVKSVETYRQRAREKLREGRSDAGPRPMHDSGVLRIGKERKTKG